MVIQSKRLKGKSYRDKAMMDVDEPKPKGKKAEATKLETKEIKVPQKAVPRNGMLVEVEIPERKKRSASSTAPSSPTSSVVVGDDSDVPKRKRAKKAPIVVDDDDDEFDVPRVTTKLSRLTKRDIDSSDYEASSAPGTTSEMDIDEDEDDVPKKKDKGKAVVKKTKGKGKASSAASSEASESEATDAMDIDEPVGKKGKAAKSKATKGKSTKRKSAGESDDEDVKRPAKKPRREDSDPWNLSKKSVRKDWTQMKAPPLEMFYFSRLVIDEYTYLEGRTHSMITNLTAERHWVLSGTPPIQDFGALKTISAFLDIHLGVDDDGEGESAKKRKREQTGESRDSFVDYLLMYTFSSCREVPFIPRGT